MRVLFLAPEQYVPYDREPSYYELELPILHCGAVTEHRDFVYQRVLGQEGRRVMQQKLLEEVARFRPDLVVYSTTWEGQLIDAAVMRQIMDAGHVVYTHLWDSWTAPRPHELELFLGSNYLGVADSVSTYRFYSAMVGGQRHARGVLFTPGHNVFTDLIHQRDLPRDQPVTVLGSNELARAELVQFLRVRLGALGVPLNKAGGLIDSTRRRPGAAHLSDDWVTWERYAEIINRSRICISSQTHPGRYQIKGKVFDYMAGGAMVLSDDNAELRQVVPDDCIVYFEDPQDCLEKVVHYLTHEEERARVAERGHRWFCESFDYKRFWRHALTAMVNGDEELPPPPFRQGGDVSLAHELKAPEARTLPRPSAPWERGRRVFCALPWYKLELQPTGNYGPCCHIHFKGSRTPSSAEELDGLWNSEQMMGLRQRLLRGQVGGELCERCPDRLYDTDHDIFGMGRRLPRYSTHGAAFDRRWNRANDAFRRGRVRLEHLPLELYLFTSERCNLRCVMCPQDRRLQDLDTTRVKALVSEIGFENLDRIGWVGGEPFLTRDALDLLSFCAAEETGGACVYITTNGTLAHRHLDSLERIDNLLLSFSIDGVGQTYEGVRAGARWDRLRQNLSLLAERRALHPGWRFNIASVVMRSTVADIPSMVELAHDVDASLYFAPIGGGDEREDIFHNPWLVDDVPELVRTVQRARRRADDLGMVKASDSLAKVLLRFEQNVAALGGLGAPLLEEIRA